MKCLITKSPRHAQFCPLPHLRHSKVYTKVHHICCTTAILYSLVINHIENILKIDLLLKQSGKEDPTYLDYGVCGRINIRRCFIWEESETAKFSNLGSHFRYGQTRFRKLGLNSKTGKGAHSHLVSLALSIPPNCRFCLLIGVAYGHNCTGHHIDSLVGR
jgi:hypothetical protein